MDRSWMYDNRATESWATALNEFLDVAEQDMRRKGGTKICCPCRDCKNLVMFDTRGRVTVHLALKGFMPGYTRWTCHGEEEEDQVLQQDAEHGEDEEDEGSFESDAEEETGNNLADMVQDVHMVEQVVIDPEDEREAAKFTRLVEDSQTPLYTGSDPEHTRLSVTLELLRIKAAHNCPDEGFDETLAYLAKVFPKNNLLPTSTDEAKKVVCPLGLEVQRFHACPND